MVSKREQIKFVWVVILIILLANSYTMFVEAATARRIPVEQATVNIVVPYTYEPLFRENLKSSTSTLDSIGYTVDSFYDLMIKQNMYMDAVKFDGDTYHEITLVCQSTIANDYKGLNKAYLTELAESVISESNNLGVEAYGSDIYMTDSATFIVFDYKMSSIGQYGREYITCIDGMSYTLTMKSNVILDYFAIDEFREMIDTFSVVNNQSSNKKIEQNKSYSNTTNVVNNSLLFKFIGGALSGLIIGGGTTIAGLIRHKKIKKQQLNSSNKNGESLVKSNISNDEKMPEQNDIIILENDKNIFNPNEIIVDKDVEKKIEENIEKIDSASSKVDKEQREISKEDINTLRQYKEMLNEGLINEEDYDKIKKRILDL